MKKVFNQICLLENNRMIIPWKFILCYRYHKWITTQRSYVNAYGIDDKNEKVALFEHMALALQPDQPNPLIDNLWNTSTIFITNNKNLINVWIEIEGYEYIELKKFDLIIKDKALPGVSNDGIVTNGLVYNYDIDCGIWNDAIVDVVNTVDNDVYFYSDNNIYNNATASVSEYIEDINDTIWLIGDLSQLYPT